MSAAESDELGLLAGAAADVLKSRLAHLVLFALGLADREGAAAEIFGFIELFVCQGVLTPVKGFVAVWKHLL